MPASMISADTGGSAYVAGSSIAMVATGPMPGSTPISVPSTQPMKQYSRLIGVTATPKPVMRFEIRSMVCPAGSAGNEGGPHLDLQLEQPDERDVAADGEDGGQDQHTLPLELVARQAGDDGQRIDRDHHAHRRHVHRRQATEQDAEREVGADDEHQRAPGPLADLLAVFGLDDQRLEDDECAEQGEHDAEHQRE